MTEQLLLGVGRADITPAVGGHLYGYEDNIISESVHDGLQATAFAFVQGSRQVLLVNLTVCEMQTALAADIRRELAVQTGIPMQNILLCATHTHTAPNVSGTAGWGDLDTAYVDGSFRPGIRAAARQATDVLQPVTMGISAGESLVGVNRREQLRDGSIDFGQSPWGPQDKAMTVLSFRTADGQTLANLIHYGAHGTSAGRVHIVTRDWPGIMCDRLEALTGGMTAFFNGTMGDTGPRLTNGDTTGNIHYTEELGGIAAADAVRIFRTIREWRGADLDCAERPLRLALAPRIPREEAEALWPEYADQTVNIEGLIRDHLAETLESYRRGEADATVREVPQTVIRIGPAAFVPYPYEIFSEIGLRLRRYCAVPHLLVLSNVNGYDGYFPTEDQMCRGGYEVEMFRNVRLQPFAANADQHLIDETLKNPMLN